MLHKIIEKLEITLILPSYYILLKCILKQILVGKNWILCINNIIQKAQNSFSKALETIILNIVNYMHITLNILIIVVKD